MTCRQTCENTERGGRGMQIDKTERGGGGGGGGGERERDSYSKTLFYKDSNFG